MNHVISPSERQRSASVRQAHPGHWDQAHEAITFPLGAALKRCFARARSEIA
jgi:hypothetical protein